MGSSRWKYEGATSGGVVVKDGWSVITVVFHQGSYCPTSTTTARTATTTTAGSQASYQQRRKKKKTAKKDKASLLYSNMAIVTDTT